MDSINLSTTKKITRKKRQKKDTILQDYGQTILKKRKVRKFPMSSSPNASISNTESNRRRSDKFICDVVYASTAALANNFKSSIDNSSKGKQQKTISKIKDQKPRQQIANTDDSENSSEERGCSSRKDRKPLPLVFNRSHSSYSDDNLNDSSSEASEDTNKDTSSCKCEYLGERETLRSFWDKCLYQCFLSKRCVAGEKPKRKYRKKPKVPKPPTKKRKPLDIPLSCIDTTGTAIIDNGHLSRYEMLLYMDPLANSVTPLQKKDFETAFRMIKPSDIFTPAKDNSDDSTDYTNSDTD